MNQDEIFISIIIPVYNAPSACIDRIMQCIENQAYIKKEVLIIDDGSSWECADYLDHVEKQYDDLTVIHEQHNGVSHARNIGIARANGEYIVFVDADDLLDNNFFTSLDRIINNTKADIIVGVMQYVPEKDIKQCDIKPILFVEEEKEEAYKCLLNICPRKYDFTILGTPCARAYKTSVINKLTFEEGVAFCEDQLFNRAAFRAAHSIIVVPDIWYYYIQNDFSAMHKTLDVDFYSMVEPYWTQLLEYNRTENGEVYESLQIQSLGLLYSALRSQSIRREKNVIKKRTMIKKMAMHPLIVCAVDYLTNTKVKMNVKQQIGLFLLKYRCYLMVYMIHLVLKR